LVDRVFADDKGCGSFSLLRTALAVIGTGEVKCRGALGGVFKFYDRKAT
jgi:hypothetical protein